MLDILNNLRNEYKLELVVAHVNHMLRENAKLDEEYVTQYCKKKNIEVYVKRIDILKKSKEEKTGLEETGRNARYTFFEEIMNKTNANKIAIAHNMNDNVETIIMNIIRGSALSGLKGIVPKRRKIYKATYRM